METDIEFNSHGTKLSGTLYKAEGEEKAGILFLPGGGNIPYKQSQYQSFAQELAKNGITSFCFDFRGVGGNKIQLEETSIQTRIEDAQEAFSIFCSHIQSKNLYIYGRSMGAPVAIGLTQMVATTGLILVVPAAYAAEARDKKFGPEFSATIRKPDSWKDSLTFEILKKYSGKILLVHALKDQVIPTGVYDAYIDIIKNRGDILTLENGTHRFGFEPSEAGIQSHQDILRQQLLLFINS